MLAKKRQDALEKMTHATHPPQMEIDAEDDDNSGRYSEQENQDYQEDLDDENLEVAGSQQETDDRITDRRYAPVVQGLLQQDQ